MLVRYCCILLLLISTAAAGVVGNSDARPLHLLTLMDFRPFSWCEDGEVKGADQAIIKRLFARIGRPVTLECLPWKRALSMVESGSADGLFAGYRTPERERFADFLAKPLHYSKFKVFVCKSAPFLFEQLTDLHGRRIGLQLGYSVNPQFDAARASGKVDVQEASDTYSGLGMLMNGRVEAFIGGEEAIWYAAHKMRRQDELLMLEQPLHPARPAYLMLSKAAPIDDREQLIDALNQVLEQMWQSGEVEAVIDRYVAAD